MVTKKTAIKLALKLIKELKSHKIFIKESYIFGSVVRGKNTEYSDIDIALVSDIFTGFGYEDRKKINPFIVKISSSIEPHPFSSMQFKKNNPFVREIIKKGLKIV